MSTIFQRLSASAATALCMAGGAQALTLETTNDAFGLANTLFLNLGVTPSSADLYTEALNVGSSDFQTAVYNNAAGTYGLPARGIAMSTGNVNHYASVTPPGATGSTGFAFVDGSATPEQQALLEPITGQSEHNDVVQLDIGFFAGATSSVTFFATFGSMEFPDFVGSPFVDGFGLYVNGVNVAGAVPTGGGSPEAININHPDMQALPGTQLNGVLAPNGNPVLRFDVPVNPGEVNEFTIILADASDSALDTTVFLSSFFAEGGGGGVPVGGSEFDPLLPSNPPDPATGEFIIVLPDVPEGETIWVDPPVSVGYEYSVGDGLEFAGIVAPSLATVADLDGYLVTVDGVTVALAAGASLDFLDAFGETTSAFTLSGIDELLGLDPSNPAAFPLGVSFTTAVAGGAPLSITPITVNVDGPGAPGAVIPLPGGLALYGLGVVAFGAVARRRRRAA